MSDILTDFSHSLVSCLRERLVLAFGTIFLHPRQRLFVFRRVENALVHAAEKFRHVNRLHPHAEVALEEWLIHDGAGNAHRDAAHAQIGFAAHQCHRETRAGEAENFFLHVGGNGFVGAVLHFAAVNAECGNALLRMSGQDRGEINRAGTFGAVEPPDRFRNLRTHVHRFAAVAPAGRDRERHADAGLGEFLRARGRLSHAADAAVGDDAFHGLAVRIKQIGGNQFGGGLGHVHRLFFERFADAAEPAVNGGAEADFGKGAVKDG